MNVEPHPNHPSILVVEMGTQLAERSGAEIRAEIEAALPETCRAVLVDLSEVHMLTSMAMGTLIILVQRLADRSVSLALVRVTTPVQEGLRRAYLHEVLPWHDDVDAAVATFT